MPSSARRRGGRKHRKANVLRLKGGLNVLIPKNTPTCDIFGCEKVASHFCQCCKHPLCPKCTLKLLKADISLMNGFNVFVSCPFCREKVRICNLQSFEIGQPCKLKNMMLWVECENVTINSDNGGATMNLKHLLAGVRRRFLHDLLHLLEHVRDAADMVRHLAALLACVLTAALQSSADLFVQ